jgi:hypothetical protein
MYVIYSIMSLPSFKFTNIGASTGNENLIRGLSSRPKMDKGSNILSNLTENAQDTFKKVKMPDISLDIDRSAIDFDSDDDDESFFSFATLLKVILIIIILWFMWSSLSSNSEFHLGMGEVGDKLKSFFKTMEEKGREIISRITNNPVTASSSVATATVRRIMVQRFQNQKLHQDQEFVTAHQFHQKCRTVQIKNQDS